MLRAGWCGLAQAKNDSVSYDLHVANLGAMLQHVDNTNAKVAANLVVVEKLASGLSATTTDVGTLQQDVLELQIKSTGLADGIDSNRNATAGVRRELAASVKQSSAAAGKTSVRIASIERAASALEKATESNAQGIALNRQSAKSNAQGIAANKQSGALAQQQQQQQQKATNGSLKSLAASDRTHAAEFDALNTTVFSKLKAASSSSQGGGDPTLQQQVNRISENMKQYGLYTQCSVGSWSSFGKCSRECDTGESVRTRSVKPLAGFEGVADACPTAKEKAACNTGPCAKDCAVGNFSNWTACSSQCGPGTQVRTRKLLRGAVGGGSCPKLFESQKCEVNTVGKGTGCMNAVLQILEGTWTPKSTGSKGYKICAGGEIDSAAKLKPFKECQLIAGSLKFFVPARI